jgi:hypothetical protein
MREHSYSNNRESVCDVHLQERFTKVSTADKRKYMYLMGFSCFVGWMYSVFVLHRTIWLI